MATHEVANQPPALVDWDLLTTDRALAEALRREGAGWAEGELAALGGRLGEAEVLDWGLPGQPLSPGPVCLRPLWPAPRRGRVPPGLVVPALRRQADAAAEWVPRICTTRYDPRSRPAGEKAGVLVGVAMTEKQGVP